MQTNVHNPSPLYNLHIVYDRHFLHHYHYSINIVLCAYIMAVEVKS